MLHPCKPVLASQYMPVTKQDGHLPCGCRMKLISADRQWQQGAESLRVSIEQEMASKVARSIWACLVLLLTSCKCRARCFCLAKPKPAVLMLVLKKSCGKPYYATTRAPKTSAKLCQVLDCCLHVDSVESRIVAGTQLTLIHQPPQAPVRSCSQREGITQGTLHGHNATPSGPAPSHREQCIPA